MPIWCSDDLRGPMSSLESVSLVSVFSGILQYKSVSNKQDCQDSMVL